MMDCISGTASPICPLCRSSTTAEQFVSGGREFYECATCDLLFVSSAHFLSAAEERKRYDCHQNDSADPGYREFLSRIKDPLVAKLTPGMCGLDFGCGATDTLAQMFQASGFPMERYDPLYGPQLVIGASRFDFVTCSEVVEHFRAPAREFGLLHSLLRVGGWIAVMTNLRDEYRSDPHWWYLRDATHTCFYSQKTFDWIGAAIGFQVEQSPMNLVLMQRV